MRPLLFLTLAAAFLGCPAPAPVDAGMVVVEVDAGVEPTACDSPEDCVAVGGACRQRVCETDVPCSDDLECGLGERCVGSQCRFRGCTTNTDCATGFCDTATFSCAECGTSSDCPQERPVCDTGLRQCVQCTSDAQCQPPGPSHCSSNGRCVGCLTDVHCPNGLQCSSGNFCVGSPSNAPCPEGISCGAGLVCVLLNQSPVCLQACALYQPTCATGQICFGLNYSSTTSLVFESMGPHRRLLRTQRGLPWAARAVRARPGHGHQQLPAEPAVHSRDGLARVVPLVLQPLRVGHLPRG